MTTAADRILAELDLSEVAGRPLADQALALAQLLQLLKDLNALKAELEALLYENMEEDRVVVDGLGTLVRSTGGAYEKWDKDSLLNALAAQVADEVVDRSTGEYPPLSTVARAAMNVLAECSSVSQPKFKGFKSTSLKARGLTPSRFAEYVEGTRKEVRFA